MNKREIAMEFIKNFCAGDVEALGSLLEDDFQLKGPLYRFDSKAAYLESLKADPLERCGFNVLNITEDDSTVSIYYEYKKSAKTIIIAQLFRFKEQRIGETLLVFDRNESV